MSAARLAPRPAAFAAAILVLLATASAAAKDTKEEQAEKALRQALEVDYLETRFDLAEQRLRSAIQACGRDGCPKDLTAKLHAALGSVLAGGKKELEDARDAFIDALTIDPTIQPHPDIVSSEVSFAFEAARKKLDLPASPAPPPAAAKPPERPAEPEKGSDAPKQKKDRSAVGGACEATVECAAGLACVAGACTEKPPVHKNWISLSFVPDISIVSGKNVCTADAQKNDAYFCLRSDRTHYTGTPTLDNADNVNTGLALSTMRVVLGYDRLVIDNLTVGARLGFAFNGVSDGGASLMPVHFEARVALWPGKKPFEGGLLRPSIFFSGGVAEIDSKVDVQVLEDGKACGATNPGDTESPCTRPSGGKGVEKRTQTLVTYKRAGLGFASLGFGLDVAPIDRVAIHAGLRASVTFPAVTAVLSPEIGMAVGF